MLFSACVDTYGCAVFSKLDESQYALTFDRSKFTWTRIK